MSDVPFHVTRMGARFFEHTAPELVRQLELLNRNLERITETRGCSDDHDDEEEDQPPHP